MNKEFINIIKVKLWFTDLWIINSYRTLLIVSFLVLVKFSLPGSTNLVLMNSAGVEVDSDIFDELLKSSQVSFSVFTEECSGKKFKPYVSFKNVLLNLLIYSWCNHV